MANQEEDLIKIGEKVKQFREDNAFSVVNFGKITGTSAAAISRIENGGKYSQAKLSAVCAIIGVKAEDLINTDITQIPKEEIAERINEQVKKFGILKTEFAQIKRERANYHGPSYLVRKAMEDGFLSKYRMVGEIQSHIYEEYGVTLKSSSITNALFRKSGIVYQSSGTAKYHLYKYVRPKTRKNDK